MTEPSPEALHDTIHRTMKQGRHCDAKEEAQEHGKALYYPHLFLFSERVPEEYSWTSLPGPGYYCIISNQTECTLQVEASDSSV